MVNLNPAISSASGKFRSEKSWQTALAIWLPSTLVLFYFAYLFINRDHAWGSYLLGFIYMMIYVYLGWMWFDTGYEIRENYLHYHSGVIKGKIPIASIRKIERKKEIYGGMKPALGAHGIILHYHKFDDIYLSPENPEAFVQELTVRNPNIQVVL